MSLFKNKPLKKCHTDNRKMIDDVHHSIITDINDNNEINNYYLDNGTLLNEYYSNNNKINKDKSGILSFFNSDNDNDDNSKDEYSKKEIIDEYMSNINDKYLTNKFKDKYFHNCEICNTILNYSEIDSEIICNNCGLTKKIMIFTEKNSYNDPPREVSYYAYKRINHFNEWLAQFQAKEKTELPEKLYIDIKDEIKKNNINNDQIDYKLIRSLLKKLSYNKYYEHIPHIICVITGKQPPTLDPKTEEILRSLFKEIQIPFINNCPKDRKNFLSYSYVLHKFCQLLEYDELIKYFPLLKSREKLQQQDNIWKNICKDLKWQYIPSI
jgi:hypothetical protein